MAANAPRAPRAENGRRDLMNIAIDCFAQHGYRGTSIDRIAKAAGLTKGAIYYHFRDKEDLLYQAVANRVSQFERHVTADLEQTADPRAALQHVTDACLDHATRTNHRRFIVTLMVEALGSNEQLSAQFRAMMRSFRGHLERVVQRGQATGVFRSDVDAATAAGLFAGAIMGAEIEYYQDPGVVDLAGILAALVAQHVAWLEGPAAT